MIRLRIYISGGSIPADLGEKYGQNAAAATVGLVNGETIVMITVLSLKMILIIFVYCVKETLIISV